MIVFVKCSFKHRQIGKNQCFDHLYSNEVSECAFFILQYNERRLSATYWQFVLESQLRKRADVNAVPLRGRSLPAAAPTPRVSRINRLGANTIKSGKCYSICFVQVDG